MAMELVYAQGGVRGVLEDEDQRGCALGEGGLDSKYTAAPGAASIDEGPRGPALKGARRWRLQLLAPGVNPTYAAIHCAARRRHAPARPGGL